MIWIGEFLSFYPRVVLIGQGNGLTHKPTPTDADDMKIATTDWVGVSPTPTLPLPFVLFAYSLCPS